MKKNKGEWGYVNYQRKRVMLITLVLYICAIGIYLFGYYTTHTTKNIWTIIAILSILPASKSMVNLIMFMRFKSLKTEVYGYYSSAIKDIPAIYEAPFTTYEKTYFVDALTCRSNTVTVCYLGKPSGKGDHEKDMKGLKEHLLNVLKNDGFRECTVKLYDDPDAFIRRINEINSNLKSEDVSESPMLNTLRAVIL